MTKRKVKEVKEEETPATVLTATYDQIMGNCLHYTIGKPGDDFSGGLYIRKEKEGPQTFLLKLKAKGKT